MNQFGTKRHSARTPLDHFASSYKSSEQGSKSNNFDPYLDTTSDIQGKALVPLLTPHCGAHPESAPITACVSARQQNGDETQYPQTSLFDVRSQSAQSFNHLANNSTTSAGRPATTTISRRLRNARRSEHTQKKTLIHDGEKDASESLPQQTQQTVNYLKGIMIIQEQDNNDAKQGEDEGEADRLNRPLCRQLKTQEMDKSTRQQAEGIQRSELKDGRHTPEPSSWVAGSASLPSGERPLSSMMTLRTVSSRKGVETAAGPKTERKSRKDRAKAAAALKKHVIDMTARDSKAALPAINYDDLSTI